MQSGPELLWVLPILLMILLGGVMALRPYDVARFNEQVDAIGSTRRFSDVEPADWNVLLHRISGGLVLLVAVLVAIDVFL